MSVLPHITQRAMATMYVQWPTAWVSVDGRCCEVRYNYRSDQVDRGRIQGAAGGVRWRHRPGMEMLLCVHFMCRIEAYIASTNLSRKRLLRILSLYLEFRYCWLINLDMFYLLFIFLYSFRCICLPLGE